MVKVISPELGAELNKLYVELPSAHARALAALRTEPPGHRLEGDALGRLLAAEEQVAIIVRRIKQIQGE